LELCAGDEETLYLNRALVARELRMIELKTVDELCAQPSQTPALP
jgi:hypothetical protein